MEFSRETIDNFTRGDVSRLSRPTTPNRLEWPEFIAATLALVAAWKPPTDGVTSSCSPNPDEVLQTDDELQTDDDSDARRAERSRKRTDQPGLRTSLRSKQLETEPRGVGSDPLVSVVITTYNRPSYLERAVQSVLGQTYENIELIVVDDHSETPAREAISDIEGEQRGEFHCIRHEENRGANAARNTGIRAASGDYIAFLDDDDEWRPEKIERQVAAIRNADDDIGVVFTGTKTDPSKIDDDMTKLLLCQNVIGTMSKVMVRADIAKEHPLDERFPAWADLEWYINLSQRTGFLQLPESLVDYEWESQNRLSEDFEKKYEGYERFIERFDPLASEYGPLFRRKMHGWAAYRAGTAALHTRRYSHARLLLATATASYPFEPKFWKYFVASLGGRFTHSVVSLTRRLPLR